VQIVHDLVSFLGMVCTQALSVGPGSRWAQALSVGPGSWWAQGLGNYSVSWFVSFPDYSSTHSLGMRLYVGELTQIILSSSLETT